MGQALAEKRGRYGNTSAPAGTRAAGGGQGSPSSHLAAAWLAQAEALHAKRETCGRGRCGRARWGLVARRGLARQVPQHPAHGADGAIAATAIGRSANSRRDDSSSHAARTAATLAGVPAARREAASERAARSAGFPLAGRARCMLRNPSTPPPPLLATPLACGRSARMPESARERRAAVRQPRCVQPVRRCRTGGSRGGFYPPLPSAAAAAAVGRGKVSSAAHTEGRTDSCSSPLSVKPEPRGGPAPGSSAADTTVRRTGVAQESGDGRTDGRTVRSGVRVGPGQWPGRTRQARLRIRTDVLRVVATPVEPRPVAA